MKVQFVRLKQEALLENWQNYCMKPYKANSIFEVKEEIKTNFFNTQTLKRILFLKDQNHLNVKFEEWEPGTFEKYFDFLSC